MIRYECDKCGAPLTANDSGRFIVRIEAYAADTPLAFTEEDLRRGHKVEIDAIIEQLHHADPDEVEDQVYRRLRFDLCADCHRQFLKNPLAS